MVKGLIFDIRRYSVNDGPGIRTTVFLKGCPLRCLWCHNPEGFSPDEQTIKRERSLNGKKWTYEEIVGKWYTPSMVMNDLNKDLMFYEESEGGVTFSGGEPLMQPEFLAEMLKLCRQAGIHTAVDTSGMADNDIFTEIAGLTDLLLFDLKSLDNEKHIQFTGAENTQILMNLLSLSTPSPDMIIRIPVIPGFNDSIEQMREISIFLSELSVPVRKIEPIPYHRLGRQKYAALGMNIPDAFSPEITSEQLKSFKSIFETKGFIV